jgi:Cu/Ag efflux protein CusF
MIALAAIGASCSREPALPPADQSYTVRGLIAGLPSPDRPASELTIRHEPIPTFMDRDGKRIGMDSMEMPFTPAKGVSLSGLAVGDPVEFTFEVRWKGSPVFSRLTKIHKLPPGTKIELGRAAGGS